MNPDAGNAVLVQDRRTTRSGKSQAKWVVATDFAPAFDAVALCDAVSSEILELHYQAVSKGLKANGSGPQPRLAPDGVQGKLAARGKRPKFRGVTGSSRPFPNNLTRTKIRLLKKPKKLTSGVEGTSAKATVEPGRGHKQYVAREAAGEKVDEGVEFFFTDGKVEEAIDRVVRAWTDVALEGGSAEADTAERTAK